MIDGGEKDDKIIAVPASKIDPTYDDITDHHRSAKIERSSGWRPSSGVYKELPEGRKG